MSELLEHIDKYIDQLDRLELVKVNGRVSEVIGLIIESLGPTSSLGDVCSIRSRDGEELCLSEVVGFRSNRVLSMVLGSSSSISPGSEIVVSGKTFSVGVGMSLLGRVLDGLGRPMDGFGQIESEEVRSVYNAPPNPLERKRITEPISTGIRSIDGLLTVGKGQRIGIFAGSGVGKSVTLGMIARNSSAEVNVIALVGERGREVRDFIEKELGEEGLKKSVLVVATSDQASLIRVKASMIATTIAEYFRDKGMDVLLMMDSVTRVAMAQREVGLTIGEPPTTKGYTPSVFALLPRLLERAGNARRGSITGLYTVLVEGDDMNEPIADAARSILDGHIVLSRKLASSGHYPAVDVLESVSRVMPDVATIEHRRAASYVLDLMASYREAEDLINIGAYVKGSSQKIDKSVSMIDSIRKFLRQGMDENSRLEDAIAKLMELMKN